MEDDKVLTVLEERALYDTYRYIISVDRIQYARIIIVLRYNQRQDIKVSFGFNGQRILFVRHNGTTVCRVASFF